MKLSTFFKNSQSIDFSVLFDLHNNIDTISNEFINYYKKVGILVCYRFYNKYKCNIKIEL